MSVGVKDFTAQQGQGGKKILLITITGGTVVSRWYKKDESRCSCSRCDDEVTV
jgi:hypothetical protein